MRWSCRVLMAAIFVCAAAVPAAAGDVAGQVSLGLAGMRLADIGPTVVFLEPAAGGAAVADPSGDVPVIRQRDARFDPEFLVVRAGQGVAMPNDDTIFHNVFSFSRPNDFDLGVYPSGDAKTVVFAHPGLVKLYCSIHESMSGAVLVVPNGWFASVSSGGSYRIAGVPPGDYALTVWNEKLPPDRRRLTVAGDRIQVVDIELGVSLQAATASAAR